MMIPSLSCGTTMEQMSQALEQQSIHCGWLCLTNPVFTIPNYRSVNLESRFESLHLKQKTNENIFVFLPIVQENTLKCSKLIHF